MITDVSEKLCVPYSGVSQSKEKVRQQTNPLICRGWIWWSLVLEVVNWPVNLRGSDFAAEIWRERKHKNVHSEESSRNRVVVEKQ